MEVIIFLVGVTYFATSAYVKDICIKTASIEGPESDFIEAAGINSTYIRYIYSNDS